MGRVAEVIGVDGELVKVDKSDTSLVEHFSAPGDDSRPLGGDWAALEDASGQGQEQAVGYRDELPAQASPGEKRIYARNPAGVLVAEVWLKADGSLVLRNALAPLGGVIEIGADGAINLNGVTIDALGKLTVPITGDVKTATGVSLLLHTHLSAAPGSPTGPPIPTPP